MIHDILTAGWIDTVRGNMMIVVMLGIVIAGIVIEIKGRSDK